MSDDQDVATILRLDQPLARSLWNLPRVPKSTHPKDDGDPHRFTGIIRILRSAHVRTFRLGKRGKHTMFVCRYCGLHRMRSWLRPRADAKQFLKDHSQCVGKRLPARRGRVALTMVLNEEFWLRRKS